MTHPAGGVVRIGLVQSACTADRAGNIEQALAGVAAAARQGAEVVCLQELFAGEYPCQSEDHEKFQEAEGVPGPLAERLCLVVAMPAQTGDMPRSAAANANVNANVKASARIHRAGARLKSARRYSAAPARADYRNRRHRFCRRHR